MKVKNSNRLQLGLNVIGGMVFERWYKTGFMFSIRYELGLVTWQRQMEVFQGFIMKIPLNREIKVSEFHSLTPSI